MADFKLFNDKYASLFGKRLKTDDGGQFWNEFVEKADWEILEKTLDKIAEAKEIKRRNENKSFITGPRLPEIKYDYGSLWRNKQQEERQARGVDGNCGSCMGIGWLYCAFDEHGNAIDISMPFNAPRHTGLQMAACSCDKGYFFDSNGKWEWRQNNAKCGIPEVLPENHELHPMSGQHAFYHYLHKNWINQVKPPKTETKKCVRTEDGFACGIGINEQTG